MERKPESQRTREQLKALMAGRREVEDRRSVWLAARPTIEEAWEEAARTPWPRLRRGAAPAIARLGAIEYRTAADRW